MTESTDYPLHVHELVEGEANSARLLAALKEMKELFRFALLCTTPELAREGMTFIRKAEVVIAKAEKRS